VAFRGPIDLWPTRGRPPAGEERLLVGPPAKIVSDLRAYEAAGADTVIFDFPRPNPAAMVALMRRVAREVRPRLGRPAPPRSR
jgi:alkanesulfonate monooxygenase SsuD/methylene tetrahydromethanopterin reductase-like flavin-dependent oxidoreductase (luciferase family)